MICFTIVQDQDSWGGGSGGSVTNTSKAPVVAILDNQRCQYAAFKCQGSYRCSEYDETLHGKERQARDEDEMKEIFEAERVINMDEHSTPQHTAAASVILQFYSIMTHSFYFLIFRFYKEALREMCPAKVHDNRPCSGEAVYRKYRLVGSNFPHPFKFTNRF